MLGPVEFNAAGNPRPGQADEGGLDHAVIIDEIILIGFVQCPLDPSAQFRQDHDIQVFVFQDYSLVLHVLRGFTDLFADGQRIYLAGGTLIRPLFDEKRVLFQIADSIGRNGYRLFIYLCFIHGFPSRSIAKDLFFNDNRPERGVSKLEEVYGRNCNTISKKCAESAVSVW